MPALDRHRASNAGVVLVAWLALVACRLFSRLISIGAGARGAVGLTVLTLSVNAFWLVVGPAFVAARVRSARRSGRAGVTAVTIAFAVVALLAEPVWYAAVLRAFHGDPLGWFEAVLSRGGINLLIVALLAATTWLSDGFRHAVGRQRRQGELESTLAETELRALTLQLQPHFLFNTLQMAAEAAYDDIRAAKRVVRDLQTLLRRTFEFENRKLVSVREEVDFLQAYVAIQRRRFGSRLSVELIVDPESVDVLLPPLLLQPLVENSIQHGIGPLARDGRISVHISRSANDLRIEVQDNGVGLSSPQKNGRPAAGLGLGVTRRRLQALYQDRHDMTVRDAAQGGVVVSIVLPVVTEASAKAADAAPVVVRPDVPRELGTRWWSGWVVLPIILGVILLIGDIIGASLVADRASRIGAAHLPVAVAFWIPVQMLILALAIVLWRLRRVRQWLQQHDAETGALHQQISLTRARVSALRAGKDLMLSALARLTSAANAAEFDAFVIDASALIRSLLAMPEGGRASIEQEIGLVTRYAGLISGRDCPVDYQITHDALSADVPSGLLPTLLGALVAAADSALTSISVEASTLDGLLAVRVAVTAARTPDDAAANRLDAELRQIQLRLHEIANAVCEVTSLNTPGALSVSLSMSLSVPHPGKSLGHPMSLSVL